MEKGTHVISEGVKPAGDIIPLKITVNCVLHKEAVEALGIVPNSIIHRHFDNDSLGITKGITNFEDTQCTAKRMEEFQKNLYEPKLIGKILEIKYC